LAIRTREVDIEGERELMIAFLGEHLPGHGGAAHFDWLYRNNPDGTARAWLAEDVGTNEPVGVAAAFPRRMRVCRRETLAWNLGDFAIRKEYRSLGPAVILQRACLEAVLEGRVPFAYDHPSSNMTAIYKRMGISETARVVRFAKPLRVDEKVSRFIKYNVVVGGVAGIGNVVLSIADRGRSLRCRCNAFSLDGRFDDRVSVLEREMAEEFQVVGIRSAAYLNWRYLDNPLYEHEILTVEDDSRLAGYAVIRHEDDDARIMDLYAGKDRAATEALLAGIVETLRRRGTHTLSAPLLESSPLVPVIKNWGFHARDTAPFVVSTAANDTQNRVRDAQSWFLTAGDRDV